MRIRAATIVWAGMTFAALPIGQAAAELSCANPVTAQLAQRTDVRSQIRLDRIRGTELLEGAGRARRLRHRSDLAMQRFHVRRVIRRVPNLWRRQIPAHVSPAALRVDHRLIINGVPATDAVGESNVGNRLPVRLRRIPPTVLCKRHGQKIVEGGVILEFPLTQLPVADRYRLQIETNVELP